MEKTRNILRPSSKDEKNYRIKKWQFRLKKSVNGFLKPSRRHRLLGLKEGGTTESDFIYHLIPPARGSILDLVLIVDTVNETTLKEIFHDKGKDDKEFEGYPITILFQSLFPSAGKDLKDEELWRVKVLEEIVCKGLEWYYKRGVFKSEADRRRIYEMLDAITVASSNRKIYKRTADGELVNYFDPNPIAKEFVESGVTKV